MVNKGRIPEDRDERTDRDAGYGGRGGGSTPEESGEDDRGEGSGVDGVGVEGLLED